MNIKNQNFTMSYFCLNLIVTQAIELLYSQIAHLEILLIMYVRIHFTKEMLKLHFSGKELRFSSHSYF